MQTNAQKQTFSGGLYNIVVVVHNQTLIGGENNELTYLICRRFSRTRDPKFAGSDCS